VPSTSGWIIGLSQPTSPTTGFPDEADGGCGQPGMLGADIPYLDPDHH
jgi:hypothetical protein